MAMKKAKANVRRFAFLVSVELLPIDEGTQQGVRYNIRSILKERLSFKRVTVVPIKEG